jgi:predicted neuraminidase
LWSFPSGYRWTYRCLWCYNDLRLTGKHETASIHDFSWNFWQRMFYTYSINDRSKGWKGWLEEDRFKRWSTKLQQELLKQLILFYNKKITTKSVIVSNDTFFYAIKCMILSPKHLKFNYQKSIFVSVAKLKNYDCLDFFLHYYLYYS